MADKPTTDSQAEGGAAAGAPADEDASLLAELEAEQAAAGGKAATKPARGAKPAPDDDDADDGDADEDTDPSEDASDTDDDPDDEAEAKDPDDEDDEAAAAAAKDPELAKRLAAVRRTEQRQREVLDRDRAAFERERTEWQAQRTQGTDAGKRIEALTARAKLDPAGVLAELGLSDDDMEYAAQQAYARSKAAATKPEYRAAAERALRDRRADERLTAAEKKAADLEAKITEREQQAAADRELDAYLGKVTRKIDDAAPLTKALAAKNPAKARAALAATANRLAAKLGTLPKPAQVVAAHERRITRELRDLGIEPTPAAAANAGAANAGAAKPAVKKSAAGKPAAAKPAAEGEIDESAIPSAADLVRELQAAQRN